MSKLSLGLVIGAATDSSFGQTLRGAKTDTASLNKQIRETNKRLSAVQSAKKYRATLEDLRKKQVAAGGTNKRLAAGIVEVEKRYRNAKREVKAYGYQVGQLDTAEKQLLRTQKSQARLRKGGGFMKGAAGAAGRAGRFIAGGIAGGVALGAGAFRIGNQFSDAALEIDSLSRTLNIGAEALQEYHKLMKDNGLTAEKFDSSVKGLTQRISEAAQGKGDAVFALDEMGLDAEYLNDLDLDQRLQLISDGLAGTANEADRLRLAAKLFGRSGGPDMLRILDGGSEKLKAMRVEARATGAIMTQEMINKGLALDGALDRMGGAMQGVTNTLGAALAPALVSVADKMSDFSIKHGPQIAAMGTIVGEVFTRVADVLGFAFDRVEAIGTFIGESLGWLETKTGLISGIGSLFEDTAPVSVPELRGGSSSVMSNSNNTTSITVQAAPGQDAQAIAAAVDRKLDERRQQEARNQRGALYDSSAPAF